MVSPADAGSPATVLPRALPPALLRAPQRYSRAFPSASLGVGLTHRGEHHVSTFRHEGPPPAADALYALGELTQILTGTLLALMVERGEVTLDTPLQDVIPRPLMPDETAGRITLEQLATHRAGLPRDPPNLRTPQWNPADPYGHYDATLFGHFLRGYRPSRPAPHAPAESLIGMGVLGHALSRRARLNYGHAVRDLLCTPLKMRDTTSRPSETQAPRVLPGHTARGEPVPAWTWPALPGAGAFSSTVPDLLRLLDANLGHADAGLGPALKLAHAPRVRVRGGCLGLGWRISESRGRRVVWRASVLGGYSGFMGFLAETDTGVVVLSDHARSSWDALLGRVPVEKLGFTLLAHALP